MTPKLSPELANALHANGPGGLEVIDPMTNRVYMIVDGNTYRQAVEALRRQRMTAARLPKACAMEAGKGKLAEQAFDEMRERLRFPQPQ